jgi:hypothetical protein
MWEQTFRRPGMVLVRCAVSTLSFTCPGVFTLYRHLTWFIVFLAAVSTAAG